ncbi:hypothetical protein [Vulcanisaeta distributa]|uniref:hypothetical protein n=1 Tax=Vulcanisaeta distributa TaxID=164451 RepID=UPI0006D26F06|nr:hypothetical protein [Vulcanisaeta distributa]
MFHSGLKMKALLPILVQLILTPPGSVLLIDSVDLGLTYDELNTVVDVINKIAGKVGYQVVMSSKVAPTVNVRVMSI